MPSYFPVKIAYDFHCPPGVLRSAGLTSSTNVVALPTAEAGREGENGRDVELCELCLLSAPDRFRSSNKLDMLELRDLVVPASELLREELTILLGRGWSGRNILTGGPEGLPRSSRYCTLAGRPALFAVDTLDRDALRLLEVLLLRSVRFMTGWDGVGNRPKCQPLSFATDERLDKTTYLFTCVAYGSVACISERGSPNEQILTTLHCLHKSVKGI